MRRIEVITEYLFDRSTPVQDKPEMALGELDMMKAMVKAHPVGRQFPAFIRRLLQMHTGCCPGASCPQC